MIARLIARAVMAVALCCMIDTRRQWSDAMRAEFDVAMAEGEALPFALGCLMTAWRALVTQAEGRFVLTSYALAIGVMIPMAALQIGCALFGFPYLYPGRAGLRGALLEGGAHEALLRTIYQGAIPAIAMLLLLLGFGHLRLAWSVLERDWDRVTRLALLMAASAATLILFLYVLFLDGGQALAQAGALAIELGVIAMVARERGRLDRDAGHDDGVARPHPQDFPTPCDGGER